MNTPSVSERTCADCGVLPATEDGMCRTCLNAEARLAHPLRVTVTDTEDRHD